MKSIVRIIALLPFVLASLAGPAPAGSSRGIAFDDLISMVRIGELRGFSRREARRLRSHPVRQGTRTRRTPISTSFPSPGETPWAFVRSDADDSSPVWSSRRKAPRVPLRPRRLVADLDHPRRRRRGEENHRHPDGVSKFTLVPGRARRSPSLERVSRMRGHGLQARRARRSEEREGQGPPRRPSPLPPLEQLAKRQMEPPVLTDIGGGLPRRGEQGAHGRAADRPRRGPGRRFLAGRRGALFRDESRLRSRRSRRTTISMSCPCRAGTPASITAKNRAQRQQSALLARRPVHRVLLDADGRASRPTGSGSCSTTGRPEAIDRISRRISITASTSSRGASTRRRSISRLRTGDAASIGAVSIKGGDAALIIRGGYDAGSRDDSRRQVHRVRAAERDASGRPLPGDGQGART